MDYSFKKSAKRATLMSKLMTEREKISTDEIIEKYPNGVTLTKFDIVPNNGNPYPVFTIAEDNSVYYCGGYALKKIVDEWVEDFDGDVDKCQNEFANSDGVKIKLAKVRTKQSRTFVTVDII